MSCHGAVLLFIGLVNGSILVRTSLDNFVGAVLIKDYAMAHSNIVRQILPVPNPAGIALLTCGDDGRVVRIFLQNM